MGRNGNWRASFRFIVTDVDLERRLAMMKNPPHPSALLKDNFGEDGLDISIAEAARRLGVSQVALSRVVNCRAAISPELAIRLELANLSTARLWLAMQAGYDLSVALKRKQPKIVPFALKDAPGGLARAVIA